MESKSNGLATLTIVAILALVLGGIVGGAVFSKTTTVEKVVEVPKEVQVPVETIKEVEKIVEVKEIDALKARAVEAFMDVVEDDDDLLSCDGAIFDDDQVVVKKVYDTLTYDLLDKDDNEFVVGTSVKLKYLDADVEEKCYKTFDIEVTFEDGEDDVVEYELA